MVLSLQILNKHILTDNLWAEINFVYFFRNIIKTNLLPKFKNLKLSMLHIGRVSFLNIRNENSLDFDC